MTTPLAPPPKKDPQKRTVSPTLPPEMRSRASMGLSAAAAEGRFMLQQCAECGTVPYPPNTAADRLESPISEDRLFANHSGFEVLMMEVKSCMIFTIFCCGA